MIARSTGSGPELALIHGWGIGSAAWQPLVEALAQRCRVHLIDLPGYGATPANDADFAQTAQELIAALPERCVLCAWSLGALLALQAALLAPQKVAGLALVGATPSFMQRDGWSAAQPPELLDTFAGALAHDAASTLRRFVALLNQGDAQARPIARALAERTLSDGLPDSAALMKGLRWLRDVDLRERIASIAVPTLLIHGERDALMPLAAAQFLNKKLPQARLKVFANAAHAPFLADPQHFTTLLGDFCHDTATA